MTKSLQPSSLTSNAHENNTFQKGVSLTNNYVSSVTFELYQHTQSHRQYYCLKRVKQKD